MKNKEITETKKRGRRPLAVQSGRETILPAALHHFSRYGYDSTTLRNIAADAGVDMALIARLYGSKSGLWNEMLSFLARKQKIHIQKLSDIPTSSREQKDIFVDFIQCVVSICSEIPEFPSLLLNEAASDRERFNIVLKDIINPFKSACLPFIRQAMSNNIIRGRNEDAIFMFLISSISMSIITPELIFDNHSPCNAGKIVSELSMLLLN